MRAERLRGVLALLLVLSAALFAVGTSIERNSNQETGHTEPSVAPSVHEEEGGSEGDSEVSLPEGSPVSAPIATESGSEGSVLGLDLESPWLIAAAVVLSIGLAIAIARSGSTPVVALVVAVGALFALLDLREVVHQSNESNGGLVAISVVLVAMHLAIAVLGVWLPKHRGVVEAIAG